jgi:2'-hydroxyisoflavone reductase
MKILVLGGTQFVGRHIVAALVNGGHAVSVFNRGRSRDALPAEVEWLRGDRDEGLAGLGALTGHRWDACVDVSGYTARHVRASTAKLRANVGHYVFVSAVSVYGDPAHGPVYESESRLAPAGEDVFEVTRSTYGPLKVTCENLVQEAFAGRCALLRPQVIAGSHDPLDRFSYWVRRATQRGEMLAPGDGSDHVQVIDARDCARFTCTVCEKVLTGAFNLAGPRVTWAEFMTTLGATQFIWVPQEVIAEAGLTEFELPLYRAAGGPRSSLMHVSNERAITAGLALSDLTSTVADVRGWLPGAKLLPALSPEREAALIALARAHRVE